MNIIEVTNQGVNRPKLQSALHRGICENNSVEAGLNVHWIFRASRVNILTGKHGARWLIADILQQAQGGVIGKIGNGLTSEEIIDAFRSVNGNDKYPDKTIIQNLTKVMRKHGEILAVTRTNAEDANRNSEKFIELRARRNVSRKQMGLKPLNVIVNRPRKAFYLVKDISIPDPALDLAMAMPS